jgi:predicted DNA binding protein
MWITKLTWKHDCMLGNRCKKFNVSATGYPLDTYEENGRRYHTYFKVLNGKEEDINEFVEDLKKDKRVLELEFEGNSLFFLSYYEIEELVPTTFYHKRIFFVKPIVVDNGGVEHWELASWKKEYLSEFIINTQKTTHGLEFFKILKIEQTKITDVYFPHAMPKLTKGQKSAFELAFNEGYYKYPRETDLQSLAKLAKVSLPTFREHIMRAEERLIPDLVKSLPK